MFFIVILLCLLGAVSGLMAGLFGIGGGIVLVPPLYYLFSHLGYTEHAMHVAAGTSLLTIVFTGLASSRAHFQHGAVDVELVKRFLPGVVVGGVSGVYLAQWFSSDSLKAIFALLLVIFAVSLVLRPNKSLFPSMPRFPYMFGLSWFNACVATVMGIGGGIPNIAMMTVFNVPLHRAIATAAALGPIIATIGSVGFLVAGLNAPQLPPWSLGFLNIGAFACIVLPAMLLAPVGARLAHRLPVIILKKYVALLIVVVACRMLIEVL